MKLSTQAVPGSEQFKANEAAHLAALDQIRSAAAEALAQALPSSASRDYGRPFAQIFKDYEYDFFKIDPMLFSPARVSVTAMRSGNSFHTGAIDHALLSRSFGEAA